MRRCAAWFRLPALGLPTDPLFHGSFVYWFAFPAVQLKASAAPVPPTHALRAPLPLEGAETVAGVPCASIVHGQHTGSTAVAEAIAEFLLANPTPFCAVSLHAVPGSDPPAFAVEVTTLAACAAFGESNGSGDASRTDGSACAFVFLDPSTSMQHPGWPLRYVCVLCSHFRVSHPPLIQSVEPPRNYLMLIERRWRALADRAHVATIIAFRGGWKGHTATACSLLIDVPMPRRTTASAADPPPTGSPAPPGLCAVGWERNKKGRAGPRLMKLQQFLDPKVCAVRNCASRHTHPHTLTHTRARLSMTAFVAGYLQAYGQPELGPHEMASDSDA